VGSTPDCGRDTAIRIFCCAANKIRTELWDCPRTSEDLVVASDGHIMATKDWSVADTAAHVASIARMYTGIVRSAEPAVPAIHEQVLATNVDTVARRLAGPDLRRRST
jgi:hypothetical protein